MQIKTGESYRRYTYQEMAQQVRGFATGLFGEGLRRGDRVALLSENRPELVIAYLGIITAGGTAVPLDIQMTQQEIRMLLSESRYCQLKPDLANWRCGAHSVIPGKSMNNLEANCVLRVEFSLS